MEWNGKREGKERKGRLEEVFIHYVCNVTRIEEAKERK